MSIETEKWQARGRDVLSADGAVVARCIDEPEAQAIAVLPEALALLKRLDEEHANTGGRRCPCERCRKVGYLRQRAGVLK